MLFLRKYLLIIVILFSISVTAAADEYEFGFDNMSTSYTTELNLTAYSTYQHPIGIRFKDISTYEENVREIRVFVPAANIITPPSPAAYYRENVQLKVADKLSPTTYYNLANATVGWNYAASGLYINIYDITDWDTHSVSVETKIYWDGMTSAADWGNVIIYGGNGISSGYSDPQDFYMYTLSDIYPVAEDHTIVSYQTWKNTYEHLTYDTYSTLDITKVINGSTYLSKWNVSDENGNLMQETVLGGQNLSVLVYGDYIYVNCTDEFGFYYTDELSNLPPAPPDDGVLNALSGVVVNAVDNTLLDTVIINLNSTTGYGGDYQDTSSLGFYEIINIIDDNYNLSVNHPSFEPYQRDLELTEDLKLNIPLIPTDLVTLGTNLSGIYGIVSDHYTEQPVSNAIVRIENSTYSDFTSTNSNGYYEFVNITAGNYTVEANKVEYYPYQQKNLTTTANDMLLHNFDMVLLVEPVETVSDELEDALGLDEVTEEDILHFLKTYGFWIFILALIFFMYAAYKSSGIDRWF